MADIFLSYKRSDRERISPIIALLESRDWSVWWDTRIDAGEKWDEVIEREISAASCVVAVWSFESVASRWVRTEASEGLERGILVPVFIDPTKPPLEFKLVQAIDLKGWSGSKDDPGARDLVAAIGRLLGRTPDAVEQPSTTEHREQLPLDNANSLREEEHWQLIRKSRDARQFAVFLAAYPDGRYAHAAKARIEQLGLRRTGVRRIASAGLPGLIAGLLIVVPATLWLSGWLGGPQTKSDRRPAADVPVKKVEVKAVKVESPPPPALVAVPKVAERPKPLVEELLARARQRVENGDILGARKILLEAPETETSGPLTFLLAETFDPVVLARWGLGTRGAPANVVKARELYVRARDLGVGLAQARLDELTR